jgi:tellurite resistance protein TerB
MGETSMAFLGRLFGSAQEAVNKYGGNKDFLEAVCASAALVAAADGEISDNEVAKTQQVVLNNPKLSGAFDRRTIETTIDQMLNRANGGRSGRHGLYQEIEDVINKDPEMSEAVYLMALDVAEAEGGIDDKEQAVLDKIAERLHIDKKKYDV